MKFMQILFLASIAFFEARKARALPFPNVMAEKVLIENLTPRGTTLEAAEKHNENIPKQDASVHQVPIRCLLWTSDDHAAPGGGGDDLSMHSIVSTLAHGKGGDEGKMVFAKRADSTALKTKLSTLKTKKSTLEHRRDKAAASRDAAHSGKNYEFWNDKYSELVTEITELEQEITTVEREIANADRSASPSSKKSPTPPSSPPRKP